MCICSSLNHLQVTGIQHQENPSQSTEQHIPSDIPEHSDNPFLNRNLTKGILGFLYENKADGITLVYSSLEAKTFCKLMSISPLKPKLVELSKLQMLIIYVSHLNFVLLYSYYHDIYK